MHSNAVLSYPADSPSARAIATADDANDEVFADASAAPRAGPTEGCSGVLIGSGVAATRSGMISGTSTPEPSKNTPSGSPCIASAPLTISTSAASAAASSLGKNRRRTSTIDSSSVSSTADVAESGSIHSRAMRG